MRPSRVLLIAASESIREEYQHFDLERIELYRNLVQLRTVYLDNGFRSHLEVFNKAMFGEYFLSAEPSRRRQLLSVWNMPTLNGYLALGPLRNAGVDCRIIQNFDASGDEIEQWLAVEEHPVVVLSTTFILTWSEIGRISKRIRQLKPNTRIVLGGAFVQDQYQNGGLKAFEGPMRRYGLDYVLYGRSSHQDLVDLWNALDSSPPDRQTVRGLLWLDSSNSQVRDTGPGEKSAFILGSPEDWKGWDLPGPVFQIRTAVGCPFQCHFCSYPAMGAGYFTLDLPQVESHLQALSDNGKIRSVVFLDDTLNSSGARFREFVELMRRFKFQWYAFLRAQFVTAEMAKAMRESGCDGVYIGVESGDPTVLRNMNKKAEPEQFALGIRALRDHGITTFGSFVIGFPGETDETVANTIRFIEASGLEYYSLKEFYYLHQSPIHGLRESWNLTGGGHSWAHRTMNSTQASQKKLEMYRAVRNSLHVDPDMGLWYLIYLRAQGLSWETIAYCQRRIDDMVRQDNDNQFLAKDRLVAEIREKCGEGK